MTGPAPGGAGRRRIFLVAGEPSGDHLGAGLMRALRARLGDADFVGVGGEAMEQEGLRSLFPMSDIAVMGFVPVIRRLPLILRRIAETAAAAIAAKPDVLVIIDSPDFTHRVARRVRRVLPHLPIVDYVSPTVWAWRPGRAPAMRRYVDRVMALLPFEPEAHRRLNGPPCTYVGHPLIDRLDELRPGPADIGAWHEVPSLLLLPGSRRSEIRRLLDVFGQTVERVVAAHGPIDVVLPAFSAHEGEIRERVARWPVAPRIVAGETAKLTAFRQARAAIAASGTVTLELALAGVPMVVGYKVSPAETWLKYVVTVPSIVLPNLILGRNAIPEFLQDRCEPESLSRALLPLLRNSAERESQCLAFAELDARMSLESGRRPGAAAAEVVVAEMDGPASSAEPRRAG